LEQELKQWCPEYVTTGFIAGRCGVCSVTVLRWIEKGHLPAFRLPDGHYRIHREALTGFLDKYKIPVHQDEATAIDSVEGV